MKTELALLLTNEGPIMRFDELAKLLGVGVRTLENQIYAGTCPVKVFKLGSKWAAHVSDVASYIDAQRGIATEVLQDQLKAA